MHDILDRPPVDNEPPELPPFLRKRGGGGGKWVLMPVLTPDNCFHTIVDPEKGWTTNVFHFMGRFNVTTGELFVESSGSRKYRSWLDLHPEFEVPPHITFGGPDVPGTCQFELFERWTEWAKEYFL